MVHSRLGSDPANKDFKVRDLDMAGGINEERFARRQAALEAVNNNFTSLTSADNVTAMRYVLRASLQLAGFGRSESGV